MTCKPLKREYLPRGKSGFDELNQQENQKMNDRRRVSDEYGFKCVRVRAREEGSETAP